MSGAPRYRLLSLNNQLNIGGACGSWHATVSAVAKCNVDNAPYCVPNELICAEIARFLRLPVPPSGIIYAPDVEQKSWFASLNFNLTGNALPPVTPLECVGNFPSLSVGLVLFDVLIANSDRGAQNLSLILAPSPQMMIFDHSHALFGNQKDKGIEQLNKVRKELGIGGHCLAPHIKTQEHFSAWLERISALPDFLIDDLVAHTEDLGLSLEEREAVQKFIKERRNGIKGIINAHKDAFGGIKDWKDL